MWPSPFARWPRVLANPAIMNNYCYLFVAEGCRRTGETKLDALEE